MITNFFKVPVYRLLDHANMQFRENGIIEQKEGGIHSC